ncbi:MAG: serine hydrolase domain-containing protein [Bryobacteraceae bacterium]
MLSTLYFISCLAAAPVTDHPEVSAALSVFDAWAAATVAEREQPGLSIGVVYDQHLIWVKGYGHASLAARRTATPSTAYRIASISKLFTATAIMQLRDTGKLRLDDPVAQHLDWFRPQQTQAGSPVITIRHLLTHTSGMPREAAPGVWNDLNFPSRDDMMRRVPEMKTILAAETEFKYSNLAYAVAGEVVQKVSGEPYAQYVETHILKPLGMKQTAINPRPEMPGLATGYGRRVPGQPRDTEPFTDTAGVTPAANLASTVEDLARFAALQMGSLPGAAQILTPSTIREMHRVQWLRPDWKSGQGLGFALRRAGELTHVGHSGSLGGYRSNLDIVPSAKLAVIALTNSNDGQPERYVEKAFAILAPVIARATEVPKPGTKPNATWEMYTGTYVWKHSESRVMILNGELTVVVPDAENPWESRIRLEPLSPHTFLMKGGASTGEIARFEVDAAGRVTRMWAGDYYRLRK